MVLVLGVPQLALETAGALLIEEEHATVVALALRLREDEVERLRRHMLSVQLDADWETEMRYRLL